MMSNPLNSLMLEQRCQNALKTCNFAGPEGGNCASQFCLGFPATTGTCPQLRLDPQNCCGSSDPATCLGNWVHNGGGAISKNPCASVVSIIMECSSADPALFPSGSIYTSGPQATALAGCMCRGQDGTSDPDVLDGFASECVASGSAAHPTYYPYASRLNGFCSNNAAAASTTATTPVVLSSMVGGAAAATTTPPTTTVPVSTKSSQPASVVTSSAVLSSSASAASSPPARTTTASASSRTIKNTFQVRIILLLSFSMLFSFY